MWEFYVGGYQETRSKNYASALIGASKSIENTNKRVNRSCCFDDKKNYISFGKLKVSILGLSLCCEISQSV